MCSRWIVRQCPDGLVYLVADVPAKNDLSPRIIMLSPL
jgi:hypothetical protein